jgi:hypothetical protein
MFQKEKHELIGEQCWVFEKQNRIIKKKSIHTETERERERTEINRVLRNGEELGVE